MIRWQRRAPARRHRRIPAARSRAWQHRPEFYNQLGAMHSTIMIFLGVVPLAVGAFGNYLVPLQLGTQSMAFPRLNMTSY
jgi:heme/copper-type cytochrome/quinol oxidase subunit 1